MYGRGNRFGGTVLAAFAPASEAGIGLNADEEGLAGMEISLGGPELGAYEGGSEVESVNGRDPHSSRSLAEAEAKPGRNRPKT